MHNSDKCKLLIFSRKKSPTNVYVKFGNASIEQNESISHVGIDIHQSLKSSNAINARIQKARASLFSILSIDRDRGSVNPAILSSVIERVCLPSLLYGAELWHTMTAEDSIKLERFLRLAAKKIQNFPVRTRTDIALGMLGWLPLSVRIEHKKLMFLQKLCTMAPNTLARQVFDVRLNLMY